MSYRSPGPENETQGPLDDPQVRGVLDRLHSVQRHPPGENHVHGSENRGPTSRGGREFRRSSDPFARARTPFSIHREQGDLVYLLCRAIVATTVVDFATSVGVSAIYLAAAVRDNGGGMVIGSEIVPEKVAAAQRNVADAGLQEFVEIRLGDARQTLRDLGTSVDFAVIDGFPVDSGPSLARQVLELMAPQLRDGGLLLNDNGEPDYLELVRDPALGFRSMSLPLKGATELSMKGA